MPAGSSVRPRFCAHCATPLVLRPRGGRARPTCPACGAVVWGGPTVGVAVVIRDNAGRVLLARRRTAFRYGLWCLPCGFVEGDETIEQAAAREALEETGLEVEIGPVVAAHSNTDRPPPWTVGIWFETRVIGGMLRPGDDVDELAFFPPDDPPELAFGTDGLVLAQLADQ